MKKILSFLFVVILLLTTFVQTGADATISAYSGEYTTSSSGISWEEQCKNDPTYDGCSDSEPVACTEEAQLCPDGKTWVSRTGPDCLFSECPNIVNPISPSICTMEYAPVCGQPATECPTMEGAYCPDSAPKTYSNKCELNNEGATFLYIGECKQLKRYNISERLQKRVDDILNQFYKKLNEKFDNNSDKIDYLKKILIKLDRLKETMPRYVDLVAYMTDKIQEKIESYEDDLDDIIDILN